MNNIDRAGSPLLQQHRSELLRSLQLLWRPPRPALKAAQPFASEGNSNGVLPTARLRVSTERCFSLASPVSSFDVKVMAHARNFWHCFLFFHLSLQTPNLSMNVLFLSSILVGSLSLTTLAECYHPNGKVQIQANHAPCADVLNNPLNTMCCAINRSNPSEGFVKDGLTADVCLPNGLCKQVSRQDESSPLEPVYFREECTVADWEGGRCLTVCFSNSVCQCPKRFQSRPLICYRSVAML